MVVAPYGTLWKKCAFEADLTGHAIQALSAITGGMVVPYYVSPQNDISAGFLFFFHNVQLNS